MTSVEVAKLTLRCDPRQSARTRFAIEDALRTTIPDEKRLVLVRKLQVGTAAGSTDPARRQDAMRAGWLAAIAGARHGGQDSAAAANCVWFESREEAETLLLARLLAGHTLDAWYWALALPDWRRRPAQDWLPERVAEALAQHDDWRLLAIAQTCIAGGAVAQLVEALTHPLVRLRADSRREADVETRQPTSRHPPTPFANAHRQSYAPPLSLPSAIRNLVGQLDPLASPAPAAARAILRGQALRRSPALALAPGLLAETIEATIAEIRSPGGVQRPVEPVGQTSPAMRSAPSAEDAPAPEVAIRAAAQPPVNQLPVRRQDTPPRAPSDAADSPREDIAGWTEAEPSGLEHSRHAGLWLVLPSLTRLGFREWLADRSALLASNPGALLLHAIARHHRIPADDPVLRAFAPAPEALPDWTHLWRHGLDRWLRRTARRRLYDLVRRSGQLHWSAERLDLHYPAADADIELRRRALDRDPGWTDWLGLSVRYHFGGREEWL